jgi:hypothetical protein
MGGRSLARAWVCTLVALGPVAMWSCASKEKEITPNDPSHRTPPAADVAELEIRSDGVDRFATCPPPGDLGQNWIPSPFPWTAPATVDAGVEPMLDESFLARTKDRTLTEIAVEATHREFRSCYRRGLVHHPTQDGRVAIVLRIGPNGRVLNVEEYGACELDPESVHCMKGIAARLRFPPPANGSETVTIPATFTSRDGVRRTMTTTNDAYTAAAYVTIEGGRPAFHACANDAKRQLRPTQATGTFTMNIAADGHVLRAHVDPWTGEQSLLMCAARALEGLRFAPPPSGTGTVIARLNFNPRQGSR